MKTFSRYLGFLIIALGLSAQCLALQGTTNFSDPSVSPGNYYVQPGGVYVAPNGIYASIDGILIQIHTLCADENGVFVPIEEIIAEDLEYCPFCQSWYDPKNGHTCNGPRD